jgi:hypothetical protein
MSTQSAAWLDACTVALVHVGFTETGDDAKVTASTTFAAIDPGIAILLLVPLAALLAVLLCTLVLILTVAMGSAALWTLRRAAETVLGPAHDL